MNNLVDTRFNSAISALTYGVSCLVWEGQRKQLYDCILSVHESYVNILHMIIGRKASYLLKLHQIYNITDSEYSTEASLKEAGISRLDSTKVIISFCILNLWTLLPLPLGPNTKNSSLKQARIYYDRLNEFDPFKAQAMMTFLHADKDGGNMLDIDEIQSILEQMKIVKVRQEIRADIQQINKYLYQRQKLKRPKDMTNQQLNQLGFTYLLRFYSIKDDLARYFSTYCPMFKLKIRSQKNLIVDIVRHNQKPIMSASQLMQFYDKVLTQKQSQNDCLELIKSFPIYDGEGKQKLQQNDMISFNNFCSLISSRRNSSYQEEQKKLKGNLTFPLSDYYVYADVSNYSARKSSSRINYYELSLKRGCRLLKLHLEAKDGEIVVKLDSNNFAQVEEILKIIANKAFQFNQFPLMLLIDHAGLNKNQLDSFAKIAIETLDEMLYTLPNHFLQSDLVPSPSDLTKKILLMAQINLKLLRAKQKDFPQQSYAFFKIISLFSCKLDFQRKGQFCWNFCYLQQQRLKKFQQVEDQHLSNYTKKIFIKTGPRNSDSNVCTSVALRLGVQIIGLSFNKIDQENYIIQSLFMEGGGAQCGYLQKPAWMCLKNPKTLYSKNFESPQFLLNVKTISGQNCVINQIKDCQQFFVEAFLRGTKKEEEVNKRHVSQPVPTGYYAKISLECQFTVYCLDLATLVLLVRDSKTKEILSGRAIPVRHLREGLRPVFLMGDNFKENTSNYLFIHSQRKNMPRKANTFFDTKNL